MPGQHGGKNHQRIRGFPFGRQFGDFAEHNGKCRHGQQWTENSPENADDGLLILDGHISPCQDEKQLAVAPEIFPVLAFSMSGFNDEFL